MKHRIIRESIEILLPLALIYISFASASRAWIAAGVTAICVACFIIWKIR